MALVGVLVLTLLIGCGGDASGEDERSSEASTPSTPTTQPPGTDPEAVRPIVEDLLARLDDVVDRIVRDPSLVAQDDAPVLDELAEVHAPGEAYDARLSTYRRSAEDGIRLVPVNATLTGTTVLTGDLTTVDRDTVEGPLCIHNTYRLVDESGVFGQVMDGVSFAGRVRAIRAEGTWKIQQIDEYSSQSCDPEAAR